MKEKLRARNKYKFSSACSFTFIIAIFIRYLL